MATFSICLNMPAPHLLHKPCYQGSACRSYNIPLATAVVAALPARHQTARARRAATHGRHPNQVTGICFEARLVLGGASLLHLAYKLPATAHHNGLRRRRHQWGHGRPWHNRQRQGSRSTACKPCVTHTPAGPRATAPPPSPAPVAPRALCPLTCHRPPRRYVPSAP